MLNAEGLKTLLSVDPSPTAPTVLIYSSQTSPRLNYTCNFLFGTALGLNFKITGDPRTAEQFKGPVIWYSSEPVICGMHVQPDGLLFESFINTIEPIFENGKEGDSIQFDIFSAVFFLISRYEEWQSYIPDQHNRFELEASSLYRSGLHLQPVVDQWALEFRNDLGKRYPEFKFPERKFTVLSTIDVDNLFAYRHKPLWRLAGGGVRELLALDFRSLFQRFSVVFRNKKDPFDVYEEISDYAFESKIPLIWFFLRSNHTSFDRTIEAGSAGFKKPVADVLKNKAAVGIHPGYDAYTHEGNIQSEIALLKGDAGHEIEFSRQHYLRFNIRVTPKLLLQAGIKADFTMGFASGAGFRAGTTLPFYYYDFDKEAETALLFVPFCAMDGAYTTYKKRSAEQCLEELQQISETVRKFNGIFTTVFHERTFSDHLYKGFGSLYKKLHDSIKQR